MLDLRYQSYEESKLKPDAPPFIPKSRSYNRQQEEHKFTSSLKPNAQPFIPRNRFTQTFTCPSFPVYPTLHPYYQPINFLPFNFSNHQLPFSQYLSTHISPPILQQPPPNTRLDLDVQEIEREEEITIGDLSLVIESEPEDLRTMVESDLESSVDSELTPNLEELIMFEVDEDDNLALSKQLLDEITGIIPTQKFEKGEFNNDVCSVCFESFMEEEEVKALECKHVFHQTCIDPWLKKTLKCPLCRQLLI